MILTARFLGTTPVGDHRLVAYNADDQLATLKAGRSPVLILPNRFPETMITALAAVGWQPVDPDPYRLLQVGDPYAPDFAFEIEPIPATPAPPVFNDGTIRIIEDPDSADLVFEATTDSGVMITKVTLRIAGEHVASLRDYLDERLAVKQVS